MTGRSDQAATTDGAARREPSHVELAVLVREVSEHLAEAFAELEWSPTAFTGVEDLGAIIAALHATTHALGEVIEEAQLQLDARTSILAATGSATDELALRRAHRSLQSAARLQRLTGRCLDHAVGHLEQVARARTTSSALRADRA